MYNSILYTHTQFFFLSTCILDCILECQCSVDLRSQSCPKAPALISWLCAYGHCPAEGWTITTAWGQEHTGASFHPGCYCTMRHSSFTQSWQVSQFLPLTNDPTAWCHHHAKHIWHSRQRVQFLTHQTRKFCLIWSEISSMYLFIQIPCGLPDAFL